LLRLIYSPHNPIKLVGAFILAAYLLSLLAGCRGTPPGQPTTPDSERDQKPSFEVTDCEFPVPNGYDVDCGYLTVPEDRSVPDGQQIRLHVAIFKSTNPNPAPDPVLHLVGGPGGSLLDSASNYLDAGGDRFLDTRDYILFNQRGTRYATPTLDCPGYPEFMWDLAEQGLSFNERQDQEFEFLHQCHAGFVDQGIDLKAYNSAENAADVKDLQAALGYKQVNLYGISYGTRLALSVLRDHPEGIRSVILDSVYPPQVDIDQESPANALRSFQAVFKYCAADPYCSEQYPELESTFYRTVDDLNTRPVQILVDDRLVKVDGDYLIDAIYGSLYHRDAIPWIPAMITGAANGEVKFMSDVFKIMFADSVSLGMFYSVQCHEEVPFETYEKTQAFAADLPDQIRDHFVTPFLFDLCAVWESGEAAPIEDQAIASDTPTLVIAGVFDPVTPPSWSRLAEETLSNSFYYEFPNVGHGVIRSDECALEIALQFLSDPLAEPDAACMNDLPTEGMFK
jgi:pimeloyl-ACP methyl ester carboxylesterase